MGIKDQLMGRGKAWALRPTMMRLLSNDRVLRAAEGVMDARARVRLALGILRHGPALRPVDPALDASLGEVDAHDTSVPFHGLGGSQVTAIRRGRASSVGQSGNGQSGNGQSGSGSGRHGVSRNGRGAAGMAVNGIGPEANGHHSGSAGIALTSDVAAQLGVSSNGHTVLSNGHSVLSGDHSAVSSDHSVLSNGHAWQVSSESNAAHSLRQNGHGQHVHAEGEGARIEATGTSQEQSGLQTEPAHGRNPGEPEQGSETTLEKEGTSKGWPRINAVSLNGSPRSNGLLGGAVAAPSVAGRNGAGGGAYGASGMGTMEAELRDRNSLSSLGGVDVFEKCYQFRTADNARKAGMYPYFRPLDLNDGPEAVLGGRRVLMFGSNNYLGLTTHPKVREAAKHAIERFGTSMTGSRLVNGSMRLHNELEDKLAAFFGKESALVFTTGYQANLAVCSALLSNRSTVAVIDRNVHASLYDGVRLGQASGAKLVRYKHSDAGALDRALERLDAGEGALVITDGVFSAEGEIAALDAIVPVVKKHKARLLVDDAHALGVIGPGGRGTAHHFGLEGQVDLISGTFSKSLASVGGWLVGERRVIDYIKHYAPCFMFAASAAPPNVAAAIAAFDLMQEESWRMAKLRENFEFMRAELVRLGFELGHTQTAVIPIYIRQDLRTLMMWRELLEEHGVYTNPFISPGVPPKSAMLRTSYMATHTREQLEQGLEAFKKVGKKYGVIS